MLQLCTDLCLLASSLGLSIPWSKIETAFPVSSDYMFITSQVGRQGSLPTSPRKLPGQEMCKGKVYTATSVILGDRSGVRPVFKIRFCDLTSVPWESFLYLSEPQFPHL